MPRPIHVFAPGHGAHVRDLIARADPSREVVVLPDREALTRALGELRVLFAPMPPREGWTGAGALELVQMAGAGVSHFLPSPDLPPDVRVAGMRGVFADEAAEHAILMLLALARRFPETLDQQRERSWKQHTVSKIAGRTVAILGLGEIGRRIASRAAAFEMKVLGACRVPRPIEHVSEIVTLDRLDRILSRADALVVTLPLTSDTRRAIGARELALLPSYAHVIHLSRGGVVDELALLDVLERRAIAGAAIDVFEDEPLDADSPWWTAPSTIVTPHVAGCGERYLERAIEVLIENVNRLERGEPLVREIDRAAGY